jgi:hypothetical protein
MIEDEYQKKKLIRNLLDNPLFEVIIQDVKIELGLLMLEASDEAKRTELHSLNKAVDKLVGHLTAIANSVKVESTESLTH